MIPLAAISWPLLDRIHVYGYFSISPHGIAIAIGFLFGAWWLLREGPERGVSRDHIDTMLVWSLVGAVVGARLFWALTHQSDLGGVGDVFVVWRGGISLLGGIAGAILISMPVFWHYGYRLFQVMDGAAIGMAFGIFVGRVGDLLIGDHFGRPTSWLLAWRYEGGTPAGFGCLGARCTEYLLQGEQRLEITRSSARLFSAAGETLAKGVGVHQTALYEMAGALALFLFLYWLNGKRRREGVLFCSFLAWYGALRLVTDSFRIERRFYGLTGSQWASLAAVVASVSLLVWWAGHPKAEEEPVTEAEGPVGPAVAPEDEPPPGPVEATPAD